MTDVQVKHLLVSQAALLAMVNHNGQVIADALKAMDEGRYGDARKILRTGQDKPLMSHTGVIAKGGA